MEKYTIYIDDEIFYLNYIKKNNKTIRMSINYDNEIFLIGRSFHNKAVKEFIQKRKDWIKQTVESNVLLREKYHIDDVIKFKKIFVFGQCLDIKMTDNKAKNFKIESNNLYLYSDHLRVEQVIDEYRNFLSYEVLTKMFYDLKSSIPSVSQIPVKLKFKNITSKYGHCVKYRGEILLSTRLIHLPLDIINYIIIHELCHLIQPNHSRLFYGEISKYCSNYKNIILKMKELAIVYYKS